MNNTMAALIGGVLGSARRIATPSATVALAMRQLADEMHSLVGQASQEISRPLTSEAVGNAD